MASPSRIKFNPMTKEIEIEGTEKFVRTYFEKLSDMMTTPGKERPAQKDIKATPKPMEAKEKKIKKLTVKGGPQKPNRKPGREGRAPAGDNTGKALKTLHDNGQGVPVEGLGEKARRDPSQMQYALKAERKKVILRKFGRGKQAAIGSGENS